MTRACVSNGDDAALDVVARRAVQRTSVNGVQVVDAVAGREELQDSIAHDVGCLTVAVSKKLWSSQGRFGGRRSEESKRAARGTRLELSSRGLSRRAGVKGEWNRAVDEQE